MGSQLGVANLLTTSSYLILGFDKDV